MIVDKEAYIRKIDIAADFIRTRVPDTAEICIVLGSGLGPLADICEDVVTVDYTDIPGFPLSTAPGHKGKLIYGVLSGKKVFMMSGRFHYYEGYEYVDVVFYIRVMARLGVKSLILTNAAGGIKEGMKPASLMIIEDHISFLVDSPLRGPNLDEFGVRFPDQTEVYDREYIDKIQQCADNLGIEMSRGTYVFCKGPQYETPAEIRALKAMGAGAVGMSTVPEAITASHCGMRVAAISCISNLAAGLSPHKLTSEEVIINAGKVSEESCALIRDFVAIM
ncbi:MAG: purine-nucleoside phosphorylase [Clostridiales bacterium]|nr:purine-nucleoside phosphorylase [Clostridiales bacterium]